ncbi:hypothetical protein GH714_026020 [Hevea brasiliensis]|uniref:Uncharacterized protein n=1 Tax=Hevea brasiliensis TaxID=3981 RepID=A0A6A6K730_HEVBR|nr:hypothetical protein GH714_026020 [Hevea brasiliensis]
MAVMGDLGLAYSTRPELVLPVHAYERSNRVCNHKLDPCGPVYITVGDGGNLEKMAIEHVDEPGNFPEPSTTPDPCMGGFCAINFTTGPAADNALSSANAAPRRRLPSRTGSSSLSRNDSEGRIELCRDICGLKLRDGGPPTA